LACPAWPAEAAALAARTIHACPDALSEDTAFQLRIRGCDVVERFTEGRGRVQPRFRVTPQADAPSAQALQGRRRVKDAAEGPVDAPHEYEIHAPAGGMV
jgi:hypothetical protein